MKGSYAAAGERRILFVMAAEPEYGHNLKARFEPLITGVGPVESATAVAMRLAGAPSLPDVIICLGSAGSRTLEHCGVDPVSSVSYRAMDASALGFAQLPTGAAVEVEAIFEIQS